MSKRNALFMFIDGIGLGLEDNDCNPLSRYGLPSLEQYFGRLTAEALNKPKLKGNCLATPLDANLGVKGIPQSATGTATLLTGINCAKYMGRHCPAYPPLRLRRLIRRENIFVKLSKLDFECDFANAYRRPWLWRLWGVRASVTTISALSGIGWLRDLAMLKRGDAVYHDIDNSTLVARGYNIEIIEPERAGENLLSIMNSSDFTLFEFFLTDIAGHSRDMGYAGSVLHKLDEFLGAVLDNIPDRTLMVISSDHGNLEDITTKSHTNNSVPGLFMGDKAFLRNKRNKLSSIVDITPTIIEYFTTGD